ncbi:MAG: pyridoxal 5'-phosphate synthase lyase subunit PdxS, partial [Acidobacteriota bacterium]
MTQNKADGKAANGNAANGNATDGNATDGNATDGNAARVNGGSESAGGSNGFSNAVTPEEGFEVKVGLARMLQGGVIMDVTSAEEARIAEDAGAVAVMALERVPADIRKAGGVARMASVERVVEIQEAVTIPTMAKARMGHFQEARVLEELGFDFIDESEVLTPADNEHHIDKTVFRVP